MFTMHLISAGSLHSKGFGGHADSVFNEKQGRNHGNTLLYARTRLLQSNVLSHTDTVHVAEDASESAFIRYPGADEIMTGSRHWRIMLEKVADSARKAVKLAEPYKPYGGQFLEFCSISLSIYQTWYMDKEMAGIVGWSKTMIEKQRVPGSSPAWKWKDFFQPCCDPQLIGNSWPGTRKTWMQ